MEHVHANAKEGLGREVHGNFCIWCRRSKEVVASNESIRHRTISISDRLVDGCCWPLGLFGEVMIAIPINARPLKIYITREPF